jgi:hypothetical protein
MIVTPGRTICYQDRNPSQNFRITVQFILSINDGGLFLNVLYADGLALP